MVIVHVRLVRLCLLLFLRDPFHAGFQIADHRLALVNTGADPVKDGILSEVGIQGNDFVVGGLVLRESCVLSRVEDQIMLLLDPVKIVIVIRL